MRTARILIPLTAIVLFSMPALAETRYRFEVFGAGTQPRGKDFEITLPQTTVPFDCTQKFSLGGRAGVRLGADGRGHWGQDFIYSYGTNSSTIRNRVTGGQFSFQNRIHQFSYNALWYPMRLRPKATVFPYLTAGAGGMFVTLSQRTVNTGVLAGLGTLKNDTEFAFNAGGGVRFRWNDVYGFRLDVRDYMSRAVRYGLPRASGDPNATVFPVTGVFHNLEFSFAFVYYFKPSVTR